MSGGAGSASQRPRSFCSSEGPEGCSDRGRTFWHMTTGAGDIVRSFPPLQRATFVDVDSLTA